MLKDGKDRTKTMPKLYQMTKEEKRKSRAKQGDVKALITLGKEILGQTD